MQTRSLRCLHCTQKRVGEKPPTGATKLLSRDDAFRETFLIFTRSGSSSALSAWVWPLTWRIPNIRLLGQHRMAHFGSVPGKVTLCSYGMSSTHGPPSHPPTMPRRPMGPLRQQWVAGLSATPPCPSIHSLHRNSQCHLERDRHFERSAGVSSVCPPACLIQ